MLWLPCQYSYAKVAWEGLALSEEVGRPVPLFPDTRGYLPHCAPFCLSGVLASTPMLWYWQPRLCVPQLGGLHPSSVVPDTPAFLLLLQPSRITIKTGQQEVSATRGCKGALLGLAGPGQDSLGLAKAPGKPQAVVHIHLLALSLGADMFSHKAQGISQEHTTAALDRHSAIASLHSSGEA